MVRGGREEGRGRKREVGGGGGGVRGEVKVSERMVKEKGDEMSVSMIGALCM